LKLCKKIKQKKKTKGTYVAGTWEKIHRKSASSSPQGKATWNAKTHREDFLRKQLVKRTQNHCRGKREHAIKDLCKEGERRQSEGEEDEKWIWTSSFPTLKAREESRGLTSGGDPRELCITHLLRKQLGKRGTDGTQEIGRRSTARTQGG